MGISGLNTFMDNEDRRIGIYKDFNIYGKKIIIDGCGLVYLLHLKRDIPYQFGGDYSQYATAVRNYFETLKKFEIVPVVVFNGSYGESREEFDKHQQRLRIRWDDVSNYLNGKKHSSFSPINHYEVFKNILSEKEIDLIQCDYGGDEKIAALAKHYECPVLGEDSDFYIYDLPSGFIRFSHLDRVLKTGEGAKTKTLNCKIYYVGKFQKIYSIKERKNLSLFAAVVGNDYSNFQDFNHFYKKQLQLKDWNKRFDAVLNYLKESGNKSFTDIKNEICKKDEDETKKIEFIIKSYEFKDTEGKRLSSILKGIKSNDIEYIFKKSKIKIHCNTVEEETLPKEFVVAFYKGFISSTLLNIIITRNSFLHPQIESFSNPNFSSYSCSRFIREITYSILANHEPGHHGAHNKKCLSNITEHDCFPGKVFFLKPCFEHDIGGSQTEIPKLSDIYGTQNEYTDFVSAVLGVDENFLQDIPNNLRLLFGCIIYWLLNSKPKPTNEFLSALLICIIYCQIKEKDFKSSEKGKVSSFSTKVMDNLDEYLQKPNQPALTDVKRIVNYYSQLQTCIWSVDALNSLLKRPFDSSKLCEYLNGTMLYNLTKKLESRVDYESFVNTLFEGEEVAVGLFRMYTNKINKKIPNYFNRA